MQAQRVRAMGRDMGKVIVSFIALAAAPVLAAGPIGTAQRGTYVCELPGHAAGAAGAAQPQQNFRIASASRYQSDRGNGTYLRQGDTIRFTSGPRAGEVYRMESENFLRRLDGQGRPSRLRCVRSGD